MFREVVISMIDKLGEGADGYLTDVVFALDCHNNLVSFINEAMPPIMS